MRRRNTLRLSAANEAQVWTHLGVIDLGSNAIRLQVARVFADGEFDIIHDEREPVRLGEEVFRTGALSPEAVSRALQTLSRYADIARRHGAGRVRSVATSAVREASNGAFFAEQIEKTTGLKIEVISGADEARLIARGVLSGFGAPTKRVALVDIGGGSTEVSVVDRGTLAFSRSLPLGSVRLTEGFVRSDPLVAEDEGRMRDHVREVLREQLPVDQVRACQTVVGSAGTIGALGNFIRRRPSGPRQTAGRLRSSFSFRELERACLALRGMDLAKRQATRGIEEKRAEIIVAGSLLLHELCRHVEARSIKVVRRGLRDGLMLEEIERLGAAPSQPAELPQSHGAETRTADLEPAGERDLRDSRKPA